MDQLYQPCPRIGFVKPGRLPANTIIRVVIPSRILNGVVTVEYWEKTVDITDTDIKEQVLTEDPVDLCGNGMPLLPIPFGRCHLVEVGLDTVGVKILDDRSQDIGG